MFAPGGPLTCFASEPASEHDNLVDITCLTREEFDKIMASNANVKFYGHRSDLPPAMALFMAFSGRAQRALETGTSFHKI